MDNAIHQNAIDSINYGMAQFEFMYPGKFKNTFSDQRLEDGHKAQALDLFINHKIDLERAKRALNYINEHKTDGYYEWPDLANIVAAWKMVKQANHGALKPFEDSREVLRLAQLKEENPDHVALLPGKVAKEKASKVFDFDALQKTIAEKGATTQATGEIHKTKREKDREEQIAKDREKKAFHDKILAEADTWNLPDINDFLK